MNNVSKKKIAAGYVVLLAVLLYSLFFVHREMENLMSSDNSDILRTDSLIGLLREKDANTVRLLRTLSEANDSMISAREVEQIIAEQDTIITQQRVQRRVTARRDTVVTQPKKKGFFRRLGEVFVPPRKDSAVQVQTTLEVATDTVLDAYNPVDSLHAKLRTVAQQKKATNSVIQRRKRTLQRLDHALSARIDSLLKGYEQETLLRAREEAEANKLIEDAHLLEEIGCFALVLEKIPAELAARVASELTIPVIGIGAGGGVDGQVLVMHDMLGINQGFSPRFLRRYANLGEEITRAVQAYIEDVKSQDFPNEKEQY